MLEEAIFILENISKIIAEITVQINEKELELQGLPLGNFVCCSSGGKSKWYVSDGHTKTYIPKKDRKKAQNLAYKKYLELCLSELYAKKRALEQFYVTYSKIKPASMLLEKSVEMRKLVHPFITSFSEKAKEWMSASYIKNTKNPENLIHKSISGNILRSKSETLIDMCLFNANIPYRYECQLILEKSIIYPDFTILNAKTGRIVYWEHFGCMDNPEYAMKACEKIKTYVSNGIIPGVDLIITFETKDNPLTAEKVMNIVNEHFL